MHTQSKTKVIIVIICAALGFLGVGLATVLKNNRDTYQNATTRPITKAELSQADGKMGHACYVAIDDTVYEIKNSPLWVDGKHTTSEGKAYCGADLSKIIDQAPHGRSKLEQLPKVGPLLQ